MIDLENALHPCEYCGLSVDNAPALIAELRAARNTLPKLIAVAEAADKVNRLLRAW